MIHSTNSIFHRVVFFHCTVVTSDV